MDEKELIARAKGGDAAAFESLVELYKNRAFSLAFVRLRNREDARDVMQEVFIRIYYNLKKFDMNRNFFSWFYKIELNLIKNFYRHKKSIKENTDETILEDLVCWESEDLSAEDKMTVWNALDKLNHDEKNIILLRYFDVLNDSQIAEILDMTPENVRVKIFRTKQKLIKEIGGEPYGKK